MGRQRTDHTHLVDELHAQLTARFAEMTTSAQWCDYLSRARRFHRYSAQNQLLLALQGAQGHVAGYRNWQHVPAQDGRTCQVRKDEVGLKILAPLTFKTTDVDDTGNETTRHRLRGFRTVNVFHEGQLVSPPDLPDPVLPELLTGPNRWQHVWVAVNEHLAADGFSVDIHQRSPIEEWNGMTIWSERAIKIAHDLEPPQRVKTLFHEWAHVQLGHETRHADRAIKEVEAESVAYLLSQTVGLDSDPYSVPYIAGWAEGDIDVVHAAAQEILTTTKRLVDTLEQQLGIELTPAALDHTMSPARPEPVQVIETQPAGDQPAWPAPRGQAIQATLELDGIDPPPEAHTRIAKSDADFLQAIIDDLEPDQRDRFAELLLDPTCGAEIAAIAATAGHTAGQTARVLRSANFELHAIRDALLAPVPEDHELATLFTTDETRSALLQLDPNIDIDELIPTPMRERERTVMHLRSSQTDDLTRIQRAINNGDEPARIAALTYGLDISPTQAITICAALDTQPHRTVAIAIAIRQGDGPAALDDLVEAWSDLPGGWETHLYPSMVPRPTLHVVPDYDSTRAILDRWAGRHPPTQSSPSPAM